MQLGPGTGENAAGNPFQLIMGSTPSFSRHTACFKTLIQLLGNIQTPAGGSGEEDTVLHGAEGPCHRLTGRARAEQTASAFFIYSALTLWQ